MLFIGDYADFCNVANNLSFVFIFLFCDVVVESGSFLEMINQNLFMTRSFQVFPSSQVYRKSLWIFC